MKKLIFMLTLISALPAWAQAVIPPNQAQTTNTRPTISADFDQRVRNARIWVDGTEFTSQARTSGDTVTLVPPYNLDYGVHQVQVVTDNGRQTNWSFAIVNPTGQAYNYPYNNNQGFYNNNNVPYNNNAPYYNNNQTYYPSNDPSYNNNQSYYPDNNRINLEDILPALLPRILNR